tara:strand:- start:606 stop:818 length:213 start_codon:yes stop_codon:yes gene_type:complete
MIEDIFMPFYRDEDESWLEAAKRHADNYNLSHEVEAIYYDSIREGLDDLQAAIESLDKLNIPLDGMPEEK